MMLHYERKGSGDDTLVIIHGFLGGSKIFDKVIDELQKNHEILIVDLPGHGKSPLEKESYTVYDYAQAVADILAHEKISNATWLGHSMGGYIVLAALEKKMAKIDKAILVHSTDCADSADTMKKRDEQITSIQQNGVQSFVDNSIAKFFGTNALQEDIELARQIGYESTEEGLVAALQAMKQRPDQKKLLADISTPILIIEGKDDQVVPPIETENIAVQKLITNSGHLGMLEDEKAFLKAIKQFLGT